MVNCKYACITINIQEDDPWTPPDTLPDGLTLFLGQLETAETGQLHWQCYAESKFALSYTGWKEAIQDNTAHIENRKGTRTQAIQYCQKEDSRIGGDGNSFALGNVPTSPRKRTDLNEPFTRALGARTYQEALDIIRTDASRDYIINNMQITKTLRIEFMPQESYPKKEFLVPKIQPELLQTMAIIFLGPSGIGKTQYAISHFDRPLVVSHIDDLKKLSPLHDGLLFDDMIFSHWPPNACIHLCDLELSRSINVKYGTITIPKQLPRIFTSNREFRTLFSTDATEGEWNAIERRCYIRNFDVDEELFEK